MSTENLWLDVYNIIAKTWKPPRCSSVGEWIRKLLYVQIRTSSVLERNELSGHGKPWRELVERITEGKKPV